MSSKMRLTRLLVLIGGIGAVGWGAQTPQDGSLEFAVLRADRVAVWVSTGESASLNCSITGTGSLAQMNCNSRTMQHGVPLVYHTALVVASNGVGYVVSCGGGILRRIGCKPMIAGETLRGSVEGERLSLSIDDKFRNYRIETSAYIGPISQNVGQAEPTTPSAPLRSVSDAQAASPRPKPAIHVEPPNSTGSSGAPTGEAEVPAKTGKAMFTSDPQGADIYVDNKFVGSTPSLIELPPGSHSIRIEAKGRKPWTRVLDVTAGNKVTIQAVLAAGQ